MPLNLVINSCAKVGSGFLKNSEFFYAGIRQMTTKIIKFACPGEPFFKIFVPNFKIKYTFSGFCPFRVICSVRAFQGIRIQGIQTLRHCHVSVDALHFDYGQFCPVPDHPSARQQDSQGRYCASGHDRGHRHGRAIAEPAYGRGRQGA